LQQVDDEAFPRSSPLACSREHFPAVPDALSWDCRTPRIDPEYAIWELSGTTVLDTTSVANVFNNWPIELPLVQQVRLLFWAAVGIEPPILDIDGYYRSARKRVNNESAAPELHAPRP
jgi:hypothetical protein